jgi:hypothetical protein
MNEDVKQWLKNTGKSIGIMVAVMLVVSIFGFALIQLF